MNDLDKRVVDLDINDVLPNRFQPRVKFNEDAIIELSESIREHGIIQPIIVRPIGDKFEIIAGERRYKASILAGKDSIPAIVTNLNDKDSAEIALIENVQRKNLTPIEEAVSYKKILDMGYLTQEQLALKLGRSQSSIANKMRLLHLSDEVQEALVEEKISERHARSLLKLTSPEKQNEMLSRIINERLTVRKTDEEIDKMMNESPMSASPMNQSPVAEVNSTINTAAFVNSNPGFVDVNRIESQAREIPTNNSSEKVDINALLAPDSTRMPIKEQPKQEKPNGITSSLFNLFSKQEKPVEQPAPVENKVEEKPFYSDPYGSLDNKPIQENNSNSLYTFQPLPNLDGNEEKPALFNVPTDIKPATSAPEVPVASTIDVAPVSKPADIEIIDPVMPKIDLSKFDDNNSIDISKEVVSTPTVPTAPVAPTPVVEPAPVVPEVKPEPIIPQSPIIITDYDKQYDPIMPQSAQPQSSKLPFAQVLTNVRNSVSDIEKAGYPVDTDEIDLGNEYRIIITIKKD